MAQAAAIIGWQQACIAQSTAANTHTHCYTCKAQKPTRQGSRSMYYCAAPSQSADMHSNRVVNLPCRTTTRTQYKISQQLVNILPHTGDTKGKRQELDVHR